MLTAFAMQEMVKSFGYIPKILNTGEKVQFEWYKNSHLETFANRNALKSYIEEHGGKVSGSVSKKTNYLINNDINSTSGKNKDAKALGVEIITEATFIEKANM